MATKQKVPKVKAYCVRCREKRLVKKPKIVTTSNNRRALQGQCTECGTKMFKFLPKKKEKK